MNYSITDNKGNTYKIKINNKLLEVYSKKDDKEYNLQIIEEKLNKRIICALEKKNGFNIKIDDNKKENGNIKIIIESEYSDDSYIELIKKPEENVSIADEIKKLKKQIISIQDPIYILTPKPSDFMAITDENNDLIKKIEKYLSQKTNYKLIIEDFKKNMILDTKINCLQYENFRIYNRKDSPKSLKNIEIYISYEILTKYMNCPHRKIINHHLKENILKCQHTSGLEICQTCKNEIKCTNECLNYKVQSCYHSAWISGSLRNFIPNPEPIKTSSCEQLLYHDIQNLISLKYYEILYNVLSQDGYHVKKFSWSDFVKCIHNDKIEYDYKFVIADKINGKYFDIITNEEISIKNNNIFYTQYMYDISVSILGKYISTPRQLFVFRERIF
jgi:hypothetical protein